MTPSNTGSRNGIITWAVIATILGLGSLIWAIISFTQVSKFQKDTVDLNQKYAKVGQINGAAYNTLDAARQRTGNTNTPLLDLAVAQGDRLTALIAGSGTDEAKAAAAAEAAQAEAQKAAGSGATIDTTSLVSTINGLTAYVGTLNGRVDALTKQAAEADARAKAAAESQATIANAFKTATDESVARALNSQQDAEAYKAARDALLTSARNDLTQTNQKAVESTNTLNNQIADFKQQIADKDRELNDLRAQLGQFRVPTDKIVQQADGVIQRVAGTDSVYINLGQGEQIAAGMTFEVYDKLGVPRVASQEPSADQLLKGKASIEVVKVQQGISECRVVRLMPGAAITEGDPIVNVVYDKNVKFNFVVYGKFNLDYRGEPTDEDANVIKRLISRWGAQVTDAVNSKTDFVVLGDEPVVPSYTQDELAREPEKAFQKEQAEKALEQYQDLRTKANQLNIPILNQTRFLYMIGYYEEAAR